MIRNFLSKLLIKSGEAVSGVAKPGDWLKDIAGGQETWSGVDISPEASMASSTVAACVRLLSESIASLPLHVYQRGENGKIRAASHPLYPLLHEKPNRFQTSYQWRAHMMTSVLLRGNSYSAIERDMQGRIVALWPIQSQNVTIKTDGGDLYYEVRVRGKKQQYAYGDMLHIKGPSLDGITGLGIISLAKQGIGLDVAMTQHASSLYKNRARPGIVLKSPNAMGQMQKDQLRERFADKFAGALNSGKVVVLEGGMEMETVGFSNDDAQFLQSRNFSVEDVARWFRVSPHMIGSPTRLAYASAESEYVAFLTLTLSPWLVNIQSEINSTLLPDRTKFLVEFDPNGVSRGSQSERYANYEKGLGGPNPWLTVADVRQSENLPFIPGTDTLPTKETANVAN